MRCRIVNNPRSLSNATALETMKRQVESLQDFKARIAAIVGDTTEPIAGARRPYPLLVRKKRVIRTQKRRRR